MLVTRYRFSTLLAWLSRKNSLLVCCFFELDPFNVLLERLITTFSSYWSLGISCTTHPSCVLSSFWVWALLVWLIFVFFNETNSMGLAKLESHALPIQSCFESFIFYNKKKAWLNFISYCRQYGKMETKCFWLKEPQKRHVELFIVWIPWQSVVVIILEKNVFQFM